MNWCAGVSDSNLATLESRLRSVQEKTLRWWPLAPYFHNTGEHLLPAKRTPNKTKFHPVFATKSKRQIIHSSIDTAGATEGDNKVQTDKNGGIPHTWSTC